jgi:transitional endoplasmic reticulum ATPase
MCAAIARRVQEARSADAGRGIARLDPADLKALGASIGDVVAIRGERVTYARALPTPVEARGEPVVLIDGATRANTGRGVSDEVAISLAAVSAAERLTLHFDQPPAGGSGFNRRILQALEGVPIATGDLVRLRLIGGRTLTASVATTQPAGPVLVGDATAVEVAQADKPGQRRTISYDDLGGLRKELARVREMIEWPIRRPEIFRHLGIEAPKGVLLSGPPGTGKTLLARAVAEECNASFFQINGPEIVGKHYGESEAQLREIFKAAAAKGPAIIFIDEIDAIAPKREGLAGDRQVERRIVAQLLTLMDGLTGRGDVIVMAATNLPDSLDPALRRPGRFDREISIGVPDRHGRREILAVHSRGMPLAAGVDLDDLAAKTHGFVGADLAALVREAGMAAVRRVIGAGRLDPDRLDVTDLVVEPDDFASALAEVGPSAIREVFTEIPDVRFADVGGHEDVKRALEEAVVLPLVHGAALSAFGIRPPRGILLAGPPGTGKTLIAKAVANEAGVNFIAVSGPQLLNQYVGESERAVRGIFAKARQTAPCILFFDEIDAIVPRRGGSDGAVLERVVAQFLTEMDGMLALTGVLVLAATNRIDRVDPALLRPGRFDRLLEVPPPCQVSRCAILSVHTRHLPLAEDVDLNALALATDGFVGADLEALCQRAGFLALSRTQFNTATTVTAADLDEALQHGRAGRDLRRPTGATRPANDQ